MLDPNGVPRQKHRETPVAAINDTFVLSTIVELIGLVVVIFLREDPLRRTHTIDPENDEENSEAGPSANASHALADFAPGAWTKPQ